MISSSSAPVLLQTELPDLKLYSRGKVRDIYDLGDFLLIVATDRISAFDVILPQGIPYKGRVLTQISVYWFEQTADIISNHLISAEVGEYPAPCNKYREQLAGRSMLVQKTQPLPIECIVRGYLSGSGWKEYEKTGAVCGEPLPAGLVESAKLPRPIFTPSTKAEQGLHDENITFEQATGLVGPATAAQLRKVSIDIYQRARNLAEGRGIIIADTKFEFGLDENGTLTLIDEVLTPDSSRFWDANTYRPGISPPSFDKQIIRDWLEAQDWDKTPPAPEVDPRVMQQTADKYREALTRLTR